MKLRWTLIALIAASGCRRVELPVAPDLSATIAAYDTPTAALDRVFAQELGQRVVDNARAVEEVDGLSIVGAVVNSLQTGGAVAGDAGPPDAGPEVDAGPPGIVIGDTVVDGDGYLTIEHRCDGWAGGAGEPGTLALNVLIIDSAIHEVVWGEAHACRLAFGTSEIELEGFVAVHLDERISVQGFAPEAITAVIDGTILRRGDAMAQPIHLDFRIRLEGQLDLRIESAESTHVIATAGAAEWSIRATNGTFGCDFVMRRCGNLATGEVITW